MRQSLSPERGVSFEPKPVDAAAPAPGAVAPAPVAGPRAPTPSGAVAVQPAGPFDPAIHAGRATRRLRGCSREVLQRGRDALRGIQSVRQPRSLAGAATAMPRCIPASRRVHRPGAWFHRTPGQRLNRRARSVGLGVWTPPCNNRCLDASAMQEARVHERT